ncbi:isopentenyl phosphate kinase family protein [Candidatus Gottesmanbacteria bacterium]|nr:isopentenyl phosphate kinase family protein [Candidatus Gottesmanbacteria bacterium]
MQTKKPLIFIKIGGSLITDKTKPYTLNERALDIVCGEIKRAQSFGKQLIVGHGAGSFAHVPAKKYQTHKGVINGESYRGIAEVADVAAQLNRIVMKKLLEKGVNAVSISPLSSMIAENHVLKSICSDSLEEVLRLNLLPVVYGDVILDIKAGCTVFSTEKVLGYLALHLKKKGYTIERIIHCGQTNGVYDAEGNTIPIITPKTISKYQTAVTGSHGTDVTGGMEHKVEETLVLAQAGIPGLIIDGIEHGTLSKAVVGEEVLGTRVEA